MKTMCEQFLWRWSVSGAVELEGDTGGCEPPRGGAKPRAGVSSQLNSLSSTQSAEVLGSITMN